MKKLLHLRPVLLSLLATMLLTTSCVIYDDDPCYTGVHGRDGRAFFALNWLDIPPDYVWTNNDAIPSVFRYGDFYQSFPGVYDLYYEGEFYDGCCPVFYYWDVSYQIWVNPGTAARCGYNGLDGADSFLEIIMAPEGPFENRANKTGKTLTSGKVISMTDKQIVIEQEKEGLKMRITYTKLTESKKEQLEQAHEKRATSE